MGIKDSIKQYIFYIRVPFALLSWYGIITRFMIAPDKGEAPLEPFKFFTIQTNLMVVLWLTLAVVFRDGLSSANMEQMDRLYGWVRGAITSFITLTFLGYLLLIAPSSTITGTELLASNINHYVVPVYFILDWVMTEHKSYPIKYPLQWLSYPLFYAVFAYLFQVITNDPIYSFLSIEENGITGFLTMVVALFVGFTVFCFTYFGLNKLLVKGE